MTPIERVRRNRDMLRQSQQITDPETTTAPFPRNASSLVVFFLLIMGLLVKATLDPSFENILGYGMLCALYGAGFFSIHQGLKYRAIYDAKDVARAAKVPFNLIGALCVGGASAGLTWFQGGAVLQAVVVWPVMTALMLLCYGLDPRKTKGLETREEVDLHEAEKLVARVGVMRERIATKAAALAVPEVVTGLRDFDQAVGALLDAAVYDPARSRSLRKYFTVYLTGVADAADKFAGVFSGTGDRAAVDEFVGFLKQMTLSYQNRAYEYAQAGKATLDIEMNVLQDYLRA